MLPRKAGLGMNTEELCNGDNLAKQFQPGEKALTDFIGSMLDVTNDPPGSQKSEKELREKIIELGSNLANLDREDQRRLAELMLKHQEASAQSPDDKSTEEEPSK
jgi:hypothetical protein